MKKKVYQQKQSLYRTYHKFCNLQKRIRLMLSSGEFLNLPQNIRKRMIRRLQLLYNRLTKAIGKQKLRWAAAAMSLILSASIAIAGYSDPKDLTGDILGSSDHPVFVDLDDDSDLDLVVGLGNGSILYYKNNEGEYLRQTGGNNPFNAISGSYAAPAFADIDDDGDPDLLVGQNDGTVLYYKNDAGVFNNVTGPTNPFDGIDVGDIAKPVFEDIDGDDDPDLVIGAQIGDSLTYFNNDEGTFTQLTGGDNPFSSIGLKSRLCPTFSDWDDDGDLDLFVGDKYGVISYFQNDAGTYNKLTGGDNPANDIDLGDFATPTLVDLDEDGDMDIVAGSLAEDYIHYFENDGGALAEKRGTGNPFEGIITDQGPSLHFNDLDGDSDLDLLVGVNDTIFYFENNGDDLVPVSEEDYPFDGVTVNDYTNPVLADIDGDSDLDLIVGDYSGTIQYFINDAGSFVELTGASNPFDGINVGGYSAPAICDFDDDGDLDLFSGSSSGAITYYRNVSGTYIEQTGTDNPFDGIGFGAYIRPLFRDYDGDGDLDLIVGDDLSNEVIYYENIEGVYTSQTGMDNPFNGITGNYPSVAFYDFDNDGDDDFYIGAYLGDVILLEYLTPGVEFNTGSGLTTTEAGGTSIFTVSLSSEPAANVEIAIESSNTAEGTVDPTSITFTPANWDTPQAITVTGVDDTDDDGDQTYTINFTSSSTDPEYNELDIEGVSVTNTDDDGATSIDDQAIDIIKVYANDKLLVLDAGDAVIDQVEVYSITGNLVASEFVGTSGRYELSLYDANTGVYLVKVKSNAGVKITKVMIK